MSISGIITALVTPFKESRIDHTGLKENIQFQIEQGIKTLLILGTTGEGSSLTSNERKEVIQTTVKIAKGKAFLIVNAGECSITGTIDRLKEAEALGADAALVIIPYYLCPTQEGILRYFEAIAAATGLRIIIYHHPKRTGVTLTIETVSFLAKIDRIIGIKDCSGSIPFAAAILSMLPHFSLFAGDDLLSLPLLVMGATGLISVLSNLLPGKMAEMVQSRQLSLYRELYPFMELVQIETNPAPIKAMMNLAKMAAGQCRLPLVPLAPHNQTKIEELMLNLNLILGSCI